MAPEDHPSVSATELAKLGTCEVRLRLDAQHGQGVGTADQASNKARGDVVHELALKAALNYRGARDSRCFIATAVYGPDAPETETLRAWRDASLRPRPLGRIFIRVYYACSPPVARLLRAHPRAAAPIRRVLDRLVKRISQGAGR